MLTNIYIIFILFYPLVCNVLFLSFMYKFCPFFLVPHFLTCLISCNFFSLKMSGIEFSHVFLGHPLFLIPVTLSCSTFFMDLLFFILIKWPNHLSCRLCIFCNIGSTFSFCLTTSFLTLPLLIIPFILHKQIWIKEIIKLICYAQVMFIKNVH